MMESNEAEVRSKIMTRDHLGLSGDRTPGSNTRTGGMDERQECAPITNDQQRTPDRTMRNLTQEEMEDMVERLRADVVHMEREIMWDRLDAATQEKKLERDNATIMGAEFDSGVKGIGLNLSSSIIVRNNSKPGTIHHCLWCARIHIDRPSSFFKLKGSSSFRNS
ncbi:hypothetical protein ACLB2K_007265 [Fragaria x ananassa]